MIASAKHITFRSMTPLIGISLALVTGCGGGGGAVATAESKPRTGPIIESFSPSSTTNAVAGEVIKFSVEPREGENPTGYQWTVDGVPQPLTGNEMALDTTGGSIATHRISVDVRGAEDEVTTIVWRLKLLSEKKNQVPVITAATPPGNVSVSQGDAVAFSLTATDSDATDSLSFRWYVDSQEQAANSAAFTLDSTYLAAGSHIVEAVVSDGHGTGDATRTWTITVRLAPTLNRAPTIDSAAPAGDVTILAGSFLNLSISASDPDGDPLWYRWTVDGVLQESTGSVLRYSPGASEAGIHSIQVKVDDRVVNSDAADPTFTWSVTVEVESPEPDPAPAPEPDPEPAPEPPPDPTIVTDPEPDPDPAPEPDPSPEPQPDPSPDPVGDPNTPVSIDLAWDPVSTDILGNPESVSGYHVYLSTSPSEFGEPLQTVTASAARIENLTSGTYYIAVTAIDQDGNESEFSAPITLQI
jgi:hypothetical protein